VPVDHAESTPAPIVTFAGEVMRGSRVFDWDLTTGVQFVDKQYSVSLELADKLREVIGTPQTLEIHSYTAPSLKVENLYLIEILPGADPFTDVLRIVDGRWLWSKVHVSTTFNLRRTTGDTFLLNTDGDLSNAVIQPGIKYAHYTIIDSETAWTPRAALGEVMAQLGQPFRFANEPPEVEIENLVLEDDGASAVERVLGYLPGMRVFLDLAGEAVFYDSLSGGEIDALFAIDRPHVQGQQVDYVDRSGIRPSQVRVLFDPWIELRLNYQEPSASATVSVNHDTNNLVNVAPVPDLTLTLANGATVARGTWVPMEDLFAAWGSRTLAGETRTPSFAELRARYCRGGASGFVEWLGNIPGEPPDPVWLARAETCVAYWRQTFRIEHDFWSRIATLLPFRAGVINTETGAFAPAEAYCDWFRRPSWHGAAKLKLDANTNQGWVIQGYDEAISGAKPVPAYIKIEDADSGVIRVASRLDHYGLLDQVVWGRPTDGVITSQDMGLANRTGVEVRGRWDAIKIEAGWKLSVLMTAVPGSPNSTDRLHVEEIDGPGDAKGPIQDARVYAGVMPVFYGWADSKATEIVDAVKGEGDLPRELVTNQQTIRNIAEAVAARIYSTTADRPGGSVVVNMNPGMVPTGSMSHVRHVMDDGECLTRMEFPPVRQSASIWRFLDGSTRRAVLHVLNNGTQK